MAAPVEAPPAGAEIRAGRALLVVSLLLPALLLALASWQSRREVLREADGRVERTLRVLHEHAIKVFETQKLIIDRVNGRLRFIDWSREEDRLDLHRFLADLQKSYDQVATVTITDAQGRLRASSRAHPADTSIDFTDRDWFQALTGADERDLFVSRSYLGRQSRQPIFNVARRVQSPDGTFQGAIALSVDRSYFETFYREVDPDLEHNVVLIRADGEILAREPKTDLTALPPNAPMMQAITRGDAGPYRAVSAVDRVPRIFALRRVEPYPVYIGFGLSEAGILEVWWRHVTGYAVVAALAAGCLLGLSLLALRQMRQEKLASRRWRAAADALTAEAAERRRAEEQLRQAQKMEAVGRLTGGVAHDFNNLLTVVIGNLEMAQRRAADIDARVLRGIDNAMEGARRAATLTHRLLAFSRQSPLSPETVDANRLVSGMSDLFRRTLGEPIAVETVLAGGLWLTQADVNQMESAILNLAVNARDAMPEGGALTIETGNAYLDEAYSANHEELRPGQYVMIAVCDTGVGMPPEVLSRVFEPFFTTKPPGKGSGLGLAQVYGFMRQSGGHVAVYSEVGHGTAIKLYFPRLARATGASGDPAQPMETPTLIPGVLERAPQPGLTVLAVEDDPMVRAFTVAALEEAGYRVLQAAEGPQALRLIESEPDIALLFTDVVLTGPLDGRRVADEALRLRPALKVLFTTGYTRNAIIHHGRLDEGVDLLVKPFTAASLGRKVRAVLSRA
ncbi:two-component system NtrC family sensor kinase [Methylobacterium sp. BE186]|uniref:hybrid sensor histidine kinase/response regulator n=1 Tax=Methylobacterium sp. BE186 TaxID=2817715 RepID=UPI002860C6E1|nr:ATP-binding protein [Methylobacterium sp. BE186]MDR7038013.1 two-component system NtrC family sensor kinase [Methylobacterium sp. BE186]